MNLDRYYQLFRDMADSIKARNIFFMPFFAAFIAACLSNRQVIFEGPAFNQVGVWITFAVGISYAAFTSELLWRLEGLRMMITVIRMAEENLDETAVLEHTTGFQRVCLNLDKSTNWEAKHFRTAMWLLYIMSVNVAIQLLYGERLTKKLEQLVSWLVNR